MFSSGSCHISRTQGECLHHLKPTLEDEVDFSTCHSAQGSSASMGPSSSVGYLLTRFRATRMTPACGFSMSTTSAPFLCRVVMQYGPLKGLENLALSLCRQCIWTKTLSYFQLQVMGLAVVLTFLASLGPLDFRLSLLPSLA